MHLILAGNGAEVSMFCNTSKTDPTALPCHVKEIEFLSYITIQYGWLSSSNVVGNLQNNEGRNDLKRAKTGNQHSTSIAENNNKVMKKSQQSDTIH